MEDDVATANTRRRVSHIHETVLIRRSFISGLAHCAIGQRRH